MNTARTRSRRMLLALAASCLAVATVGGAVADAAVIPTDLPAPTVHGPVITTDDVTLWVPHVEDADPCLHPSLGQGDRPCYGYIELGARLRGLRPNVLVGASFSLHYSESFVCADRSTLAIDDDPSRRTTLSGDATTEDWYLPGPPSVVTSSWGRATVSAYFYLHSPNVEWPDFVDLPCGPGEDVIRSAVVLSDMTVSAQLRNPKGDDIGDYPTVSLPGTVVTPWYDFTLGPPPAD